MRLKVTRDGKAQPQVVEDATIVSLEGLGYNTQICITDSGQPVVLVRTGNRGYAIRPLPRTGGIDVRCSELPASSGNRPGGTHPILEGDEWTSQTATATHQHDEAGDRTIIQLTRDQ